MTQDGYTGGEGGPFAAAEQVSATLGTLAEALLDGRATRYPGASLTALRGVGHPAAETLFDVALDAHGPAHQAVARLGTVVAAGPARAAAAAAAAPASAAAATRLLARFGGGAVRGVTPDPAGPTAALFGLPVAGEVADPKLRPPFTAALADLANGQQTRQPAPLAPGAGVELRLVVPPVFHPLTTPGLATDPAEHLAEVAEELFSGTGPAPRRDLAVVGAGLADVFAASGVAYAGLSALTLDGRTSDAALVVSVARHPGPIQVLANELAATRPHAEVWTVLLPSGPAAVLVEGRTVPVPAALAGDSAGRWVVLSVVQALVPLPDGVSVLCAQLTTAQAQDWELYTEVFAELLQSVQFAWDGVDSRRAAPIPAPAAVPAPAPVAAPAEPAPVAEPVAAPAPVAEPEPLKGTPVRIPPPDFNPFAPQPAAPAQAAVEAGPEEPEPLKGTPVRIPPPDFNPFAPQPAAPATAAAGDEEPLKGTPVRIPPPDFNPFAPQPATRNASAPAAQAAPAAPAAQATDPFGTVTTVQATDPFGTTLPSAAPAPVVAPPMPTSPPTAPPAAAEDGEPRKGTPVRIPPPDFNPFAPPKNPPAAPAAEAEPAPPAAPETSPFG